MNNQQTPQAPKESGRNPTLQFPLQLILVGLFIAQLVVMTGIVGYLSFRNGQQAINEVAAHLRDEITARIEGYLLTFLAVPQQINRNNATLISQGILDGADPVALERYFWEQVQIYQGVTSIYFGNTAGGLVDAGREGADNARYVILTDDFRSGPFRKYATDQAGQQTELLVTVPDFDARTRPWYIDAVEADQATWSEVYLLFTGQDMAISASRPVYDQQEQLLGVVSVDIFTSHLASFLQGLEIGYTGQAFIIDRSGLLVASSSTEKPFTEPEGTSAPRRLSAEESASPLIRSTAKFLSTHFGDYQAISTPTSLDFDLDGQRHFLQVTPVQDGYGIDWLVVVVVPEADFTTQIQAHNRATIFLIGVALLIALLIGIIITRWITRPLSRLTVSVQALANGIWRQATGPSWISEIGTLTRSFDRVAEQLQRTVTQLTTRIADHERAEAQARLTAGRLSALIAHLPGGILLETPTRTVMYVNQQFCTLFGIPAPPEALIGMDCRQAAEQVKELFINSESFEQRIETILADREIILNEALYLRDGRVFQRDYVPVQSGNEQVEHLWHYRDITARKLAEAALQDSHNHLELALAQLQETQERMVQQERLAAVGQLAAGIAHDFNNILTGILGYAELLHASPDIPARMQSDLAKIITASRRAAHLVRQILDFSRKSIYQPQPLDLVPFVKEAVRFLERTFPETIAIDSTVEPGRYLVEADPAQIQQVLTNLALNAREAMPDGGRLAVTLFRTKADGRTICAGCNQAIEGAWIGLAVSDNGSGIPPEVRPHIFEPFFTTKEVGAGSGLGLSQAFGIIAQHSGHLTVESQVGQGTTLTIYLPPLSVAKDELEPEAGAAPIAGGGETILLVEDDPAVLAVSQAMLAHLDYRVLSAVDGSAALTLYEQHAAEIALVLSDVVMPDMAGETLCSQLQARDPEVKVILMSGYPLTEKGTHLLSRGMVDWLQKPISLDQLSQAIDRALRSQVDNTP